MRRLLLFGLGSIAWLAPTSCGAELPSSYGDAVDCAAALSLEQLADVDASEVGDVVVSGRVAEVCSSAGCWFVLRETARGRVQELYVDLSSGASFTVPASLAGETVCVSGTLGGEGPDRKLRASGLVIE